MLRLSSIRTALPQAPLANPACAEYDWREMALGAAEITGSPIATRNKAAPDAIIVHFPLLCDFVSQGRPWYDRWQPSWTDLTSLALLAAALLAFGAGLAKTPHKGKPAIAHPSESPQTE